MSTSTAPIHTPSHRALLIVDVQPTFCEGGSLPVEGGNDVAHAVSAYASLHRDRYDTLVTTQDWHPEVTAHFAKDGGVWPVHCVAGTWGAAFHPGLEVLGPAVRKGANGEDGYSGFTMRDPATGETIATELESLLRVRAIERVRICGLATDYCVKATALDAVRLGFGTTVLADAIAAVDLQPRDGEAAIDELRAAGVVVQRTRPA